MLDTLTGDIRSTVRILCAKPGQGVLAVLTLALGISVTTVSYGLVDALVWRTLPIPRPETLVALSGFDPKGRPVALTPELVAQLSSEPTSFERLVAYLGSGAVTIESRGVLSRASVAAVSADYFYLLGLQPLMGRWFDPTGVGLTAGARVEEAVLGHDYWRHQFGGDPSVVGALIRVEGVPFRVVGITPRGFYGLEVGLQTDVTIPIGTVARVLNLPPTWPVPVPHVIGRLKASATIDQARTEVATLWPRLLAASVPPAFSPKQQQLFLATRPLTTEASHGFSQIRESYSRALIVLMAFSVLMLTITCGNVAALLLARAETREHEFSIRLALGASRNSVLRQLLVEALTLSAVGAGLAVPVAWWGHSAIAGTVMPMAPLAAQIRWDARAVSLIVSLVLITTLAVGCLPAWILSRRNPQAVLQKLSRTTTSATARWSQRVLILQVAAAVVLLAADVSFVRLLLTLQTGDPGFRSDGVMLARLAPQPGGYDRMNDGIYYRQLVDELSRLPTVDAVGLSKSLPVTGRDAPLTQLVASAQASDDAAQQASLEVVSPHFFSALGIPIISGRDFDWADNLNSTPVTIVSNKLAQQLFSGEDAVGQYIRYGGEPRHQKLRIVGVARDASLGSLRARQPLLVFVNWFQQPPPYARWPTVEIRTAGDPLVVEGGVRRSIKALGREYVESLRTLEQQVDVSLARERLLAIMATLFGVLAAVLVWGGLAAVLTYDLARQKREFGIRLALGASPGSVRRSILNRGVGITMVGILIGVPAALIAMLAVRGLLPGESVDAVAILTAAGTLLVLSVFLSLGPARLAARTPPMDALRCD